MNKFIFPVIAVILGVLIATITKNKKSWNMKLMLSFSGGLFYWL
ncbi:hypothetical protein JCM19274_4016 [Algibacter lectus]|uniref:Uncharacterized protein n=1 Tax=Algibacter lectus TaxID=221126 RepID=A0A090X759_9FLAO|nr:hypothetical protein JCM19274_4016 [Algibacter lectus]